MKLESMVAALNLPASCRVDQRVPKKMLAEHGGATTADRKMLTEGIEEAHWLAAIKPGTIAVPIWRDEQREYLEVAVLTVSVRSSHAHAAQVQRLTELIHRAIPYPVLLLLILPRNLMLSLGHKRSSQHEASKVVLDGDITSLSLALDAPPPDDLLAAMSLDRLPHRNLMALYQGWIDVLLAAQAEGITGQFSLAATPEQAASRRAALREHVRLEQEATRLRSLAAKESQMAKRVEYNIALQQVQADLKLARAQLL